MASSPPILKDSKGRNIPLGQLLGRGGQGAVYQVRGSQQWAAKVYSERPSQTERQKLQTLVQVRTPELSDISAWPSATLHDDSGEIAGFLMPLVNLKQYHESHQLYSPSSRAKHFPKADWEFLVHAARNLARAFAVVHEAGHLMGDVSGRNVMVSAQATVRLIDTDSFQVTHDGHTYPCPVGTAEYTPPELQQVSFGEFVRTEQHDLFGVAVLLFQLLFEGRHPYAGIHASGELPSPAQAIALGAFAYSLRPMHGVRPPPATLSLRALPPRLQELFEGAFAPPSASNPTARPSAREWEAALAELQENLVTCKANPKHKHYSEVACPWCALQSMIKRATELSASSEQGGKDLGAELDKQWRQALAKRPAHAPALPQFILPFHKLPDLELNLPPRPRLPSHLRRWAVTLHWVIRLLLLGSLTYAAFAISGTPFSTGLMLLGLTLWALHHYGYVDLDRYAFGILDRYRNLERSMVAQLMPAYQAKHDYLNAVETQRQRLQGQLGQLQFALRDLEQRFEQENAQNEYERDLMRLQRYKEQVDKVLEDQGREMKKVVFQHSREALMRYLQRQPIHQGAIPQLSADMVTHLRKHGIQSAYDLRPEKLQRVPGMTQYGLYALLRWRTGLEAFFQFDPKLVPAPAIAQARRVHAHKLAQAWRVWEEEYRLFNRGRWGYNEPHIMAQIRDVKAKMVQCQEALALLPED